jgi:tetratricopeptide repeat protein 30
MRQVEREEERAAAAVPDKQCFHLCIINMVIGTLYCSKVRPLHNKFIRQH